MPESKHVRSFHVFFADKNDGAIEKILRTLKNGQNIGFLGSNKGYSVIWPGVKIFSDNFFSTKLQRVFQVVLRPLSIGHR